MKKLFIIAAISLATILFTSSAKPARDVPYSIKCFACEAEWDKTGYSGCAGCPTWRDVILESNPKNKGFHVYKCQHGHVIRVSFDGSVKERIN